jgi:phosphoribosylaminoimidazole-succinocarboxamide synthase
VSKGGPNITSLIKPPEISTMTHEENQETQNQLSNLDKKINEVNDRLVKKYNLINVQTKMELNLENNINNNREHVENNMEHMEKKMDENR